ncbi:MAG TPA: hypothetical protein VH916_10790 [Dehalococcoidia bacterium]
MSGAHLSPAAAMKWRAYQIAAIGVQRGGCAGPLLAPLAGRLSYLLSPGTRRAVEANVRQLLPWESPTAVRRTARGIFCSVARYNAELMRLPVSDLRALHDTMDVQGYEFLEAARRAGKGVIVAGVHLGPAEIVLQAFAVRGVPYTAMIERLEPPGLNALFLDIRLRHGHRYVFADMAGARALLRALRDGGVVTILVDRDVTGSGIDVPLAGTSVRAPTGVIDLARVSGAPIVPTVAQWDGARRRTIFMPPITIQREVRGVDARRTALADLLERFLPYLRAHPEQWLMLQRWFNEPPVADGTAYTGR